VREQAAGRRGDVGLVPSHRAQRHRPSARAPLAANVPPVFQTPGMPHWCGSKPVRKFPKRRSSSPRRIDRCETSGVASRGDAHERARTRQPCGIRAIWSGTPGSNRRPSPWQGEQADSPTVPAPHQPSPNSGDHSGHEAVVDAPPRQPSPSVHNGCVPQVFQDGARPLEVAQVAMLLGWTKDVVRAACERGELTHTRDHLNAYSIPCSVVAAAAGWHVRNEQPRGSSSSAKWERQDEATGPGTPPRRRP